MDRRTCRLIIAGNSHLSTERTKQTGGFSAASPGKESSLRMSQIRDRMLAIVRQAAREQQAAAEKLLQHGNFKLHLQSIRDDAMHRLQVGLLRSESASQRECAAGCAMCCLTVAVDITPLEALAIAEHLQHHPDAERRTSLVERLRKNAERREQMTAEQRQPIRMACAMLDGDGMCSIYENRPLVCAGVFSLSRDACAEAYHADDLDQQRVPLDLPAKLHTMGVSGGLQRALIEAGLDGNLYEFHSATYRAVTTPEAADRYFAGHDIFAGCICTDAHSPPRAATPEKPTARRVDSADSLPAHVLKGPHFAAAKKTRQDRRRNLSRRRR